ncbi:putative chitinase 2 [Trachymyrmex septentrionalis]|uniref:chitinase n=1 Tax=Trachymyrmex septentrionalis TaxID=34720 RepID=A0A195FSM3_9HYME|nr:PREDICTED: endochitinase-like [Trachymyrmex septentrionalis]KYN43441.1 putative chitinase 2 [Trachymyrmex septentrionalis]
MNRWLLVFAALAVFASASADSTKKVVCYYGSWAGYRNGDGKYDISQMDSTLCTHMIYGFVGINSDGSIRVLDAWNDLADNYGLGGFKKFGDLRKKSPSTKMMVAIGGWNEGSSTFSTVAGSSTLRQKFAKNAAEFLDKHGFDGFDIDWEYPNQRGGKEADKKNFVEMLKAVKTELKKKGKILSIAVGAAESLATLSYDPISQIAANVDFINLMTYDLHGTWDGVTGHHAGLYSPTSGDKLNVHAAVLYWLKKGCPPEKLILGVPFYGRAFTLSNSNNNGIGAPSSGPSLSGPYTQEGGYLGYNEICTKLKEGGWTVIHGNKEKSPYAYKGNQWVGYEDEQSIKVKADYVKEKGLGGLMTWSIDTDDFRGICGTKNPLLKAMNLVRK